MWDALTENELALLSPPPLPSEALDPSKYTEKNGGVWLHLSLSREPGPEDPAHRVVPLLCLPPPFITFLSVIRPLVIWVLLCQLDRVPQEDRGCFLGHTLTLDEMIKRNVLRTVPGPWKKTLYVS